MTLLPAARRRVVRALGGTAVTAVLAAAIVATPASAAEGTVIEVNRPDAVAGSYIVVFTGRGGAGDRRPRQGVESRRQARRRIGFVYSAALRGFSVAMTPQAARRLAADPAVAYVEQDSVVHAIATQSPVPS